MSGSQAFSGSTFSFNVKRTISDSSYKGSIASLSEELHLASPNHALNPNFSKSEPDGFDVTACFFSYVSQTTFSPCCFMNLPIIDEKPNNVEFAIEEART